MISRTGTQLNMSFKDQLDTEFAIHRQLEKLYNRTFNSNQRIAMEPERELACAIFHQALLDAFNQIRIVRKNARKWLLSAEYVDGSAEWYAEIADYHEPLKRIRKFLFDPDYTKLTQ